MLPIHLANKINRMFYHVKLAQRNFKSWYAVRNLKLDILGNLCKKEFYDYKWELQSSELLDDINMLRLLVDYNWLTSNIVMIAYLRRC